jgi:NADH pyrophosphatase NudC (nudix superfamily)
MPEIKHERKYTKSLEKDSYRITKSCCKKLGDVDAKWEFCPYCGEAITILEVEDVVEVVDNTKEKAPV